MSNKRGSLIILLLFILITNSFSQDIELSAGLNTGYALSINYDFIPPMMERDGTVHLAYAGAYFDASYGRIGAAFLWNISENIGSTGTTTNFRLGYLVFEAMAKYPLFIKSLRLWTGLGVKFIYCLFMDFDGNGTDDRLPDDSFDDFFLTMAVGAEFRLWDFLKIGPSFSIDYNLTPNMKTSEPPEARHTSFVFCFSISVAYVF